MEKAEDVVHVGEEVRVKVVGLDEDTRGGGMKIRLSMKHVNQRSGEDLDPTHEAATSSGGGRTGPPGLRDVRDDDHPTHHPR